ncbi:MAG TPA: aldehyde dehydrogenase family protein, partial [Limnochordales bacterium]
AGEGYFGFFVRRPVGVVAAITPFNFPLNLVAHKVAPALAAGNTLVVKPPPVAPLTALYLARLLEEAGLPAGYYNVVTGSTNDVGEWLLADPRIRLYTFTGSAAVGQHIKAATGLRRVLLELGNNSGSIVCADADIDRAVPYIVRGSFRKAGQVCVSLQRLYVHRSREEELLTKLAPAVQKLVVGDPMDEATDVGPMISEQAAARAEAWVQEAVAAGARVVIGGTRQGTLFAPTILTGVTEDMKVVCEEIFAPVLSVIPFDDLDDAIDRLNNTPYGLQAGVFTESLETALYCARRLEFGGVNINDTSNYRADNLPYGGIKKSGIGKEGPKYAIREMTEERIVTINLRHRHYGPSEG